jgi:hypothetical protein
MVVALLLSLPPSRLLSCPIAVVIMAVWCEYSWTVFEALLKEICGIDLEELNLEVLSGK